MRRNISAKKFHTDDVKSVQNLLIHAVYERQTKDKRLQKSNVNALNLSQNCQYLWNIFFSRRSIWVLLELVRRWTQHFTKIYQEKHKIEQILHLEPHDYPIYYINTDLRHQYGISVAESQMFLLPKHPQQWGAVRNDCSRKLWCMLFFWHKDILQLSCMAWFHLEH